MEKKILYQGLASLDTDLKLELRLQLEKEEKQLKIIQQDKIDFDTQHKFEKEMQLKNEQETRAKFEQKKQLGLREFQDALQSILKEKEAFLAQLEAEQKKEEKNNQAQKQQYLEKEKAFSDQQKQQLLAIQKEQNEFWNTEQQKEVDKNKIQNSSGGCSKNLSQVSREHKKLGVKTKVQFKPQKQTKHNTTKKEMKKKELLENNTLHSTLVTFDSTLLNQNKDESNLAETVIAAPQNIPSNPSNLPLAKTKRRFGVKQTVLFKKDKKIPAMYTDSIINAVQKQTNISLKKNTGVEMTEDDIELITIEDDFDQECDKDNCISVRKIGQSDIMVKPDKISQSNGDNFDNLEENNLGIAENVKVTDSDSTNSFRLMNSDSDVNGNEKGHNILKRMKKENIDNSNDYKQSEANFMHKVKGKNIDKVDNTGNNINVDSTQNTHQNQSLIIHKQNDLRKKNDQNKDMFELLFPLTTASCQRKSFSLKESFPAMVRTCVSKSWPLGQDKFEKSRALDQQFSDKINLLPTFCPVEKTLQLDIDFSHSIFIFQKECFQDCAEEYKNYKSLEPDFSDQDQERLLELFPNFLNLCYKIATTVAVNLPKMTDRYFHIAKIANWEHYSSSFQLD